jgi:hypothetical protein
MTKKKTEKPIFRGKGIVAYEYEPPKPKKKVKPLNCEMALRHKRALEKLLDEGDITQIEYDALWAKTLARMKAAV